MKTKIIKILAIISLVFLSACGGDNSSFRQSQEILAIYPESEIHQLDSYDLKNRFVVRTKDDRVISIIFLRYGEMLPEQEIFGAKP